VPTRKQRRRHRKLQRHEYEEVWVDAEGNELPREEAERLAPGANGAAPTHERKREGSSVRTSRGRIVPPPSWGRVFKRGLFFAPVMFLLVTVLPGGDRFTVAQKVLLTLQYVVMLVLFMYLTERITYRLWQRRQASRAAKE
jgi:hypothetical protein